MVIVELAPRLRRRLREVTPKPLHTFAHQLIQGESAAQRTGRQLGSVVARLRADRLLRKRNPRAQTPLLPVDVKGRPGLAHVVTSFRADETQARHAALVADALEAAAVPYFYLPVEQECRRVIVVAEPLRTRALAAVQDALAETGTYLARAEDGYARRPRLVESRLPLGASTVRIFQLQATADGRFLSGIELGCDVQFWPSNETDGRRNGSGEPIPSGSLSNEGLTACTPGTIPPEQLSLKWRLVDGAPRPLPASLLPTHLFQVLQPVDVVYTWVDGDDPAWRERKALALAQVPAGERQAHAATDSRFASHDELRYSLRSLEMYANWVGHIYLVTDDQVPCWLDTEHPRLTVVSHKQLFGERGRLPTFNSHAIESQLHRIEGLSENFLYLNDDVFFGRPVPASQFLLANGLSKFFLSPVRITAGPPEATDLPVTCAAKNNRDLLIDRFGRTVTDKFQHAPYSLRRSVMNDLENEFPEAVSRTAASQFRSRTDISVSAALAHYYGFLTGRAVPGRLDYCYVDIGRLDLVERLRTLVRNRRYDVFCLNDHDSSRVDPEQQRLAVRRFLEDYFPVPSELELPDAPGDLSR